MSMSVRNFEKESLYNLLLISKGELQIEQFINQLSSRMKKDDVKQVEKAVEDYLAKTADGKK